MSDGAPKRRRITDLWRKQVTAHLDAQGHGSRRALSKKVGCKETTITKLLNGSTATSPLVDPISQAIGLVLLPEEMISPELLRVFRKIEALADADLSNIEPIVDAFLDRKKNSTH